MKDFHSYRLRSRAATAQWILIAAFVLLAGTFFRLQIVQFERDFRGDLLTPKTPGDVELPFAAASIVFVER